MTLNSNLINNNATVNRQFATILAVESILNTSNSDYLHQ